MKKNGFTLIEIIGVIILIVILSLLLVPRVEDKIKQANKLAYDNLIETVEGATILYIKNHANEVPEINSNKLAIIEISTLIDKGLIERKKLYKGKDAIISLDSSVVAIKVDNNIYAKYNDDTSNNVKIFMLGPDTVKINKNSTYSEYGAYIANINTSTLLKLPESNISSNINITQEGTYFVTYSYPNARAIERKVIISNVSKDTVPPEITLVGNSTITISQGTNYNDQGATAFDNINGNITSKIVKTGSVNTKQKGTYYIKYDVVDLSGNKAVTVTRTVIVN